MSSYVTKPQCGLDHEHDSSCFRELTELEQERYQEELDSRIDGVLDIFEEAANAGVSLDPLATIMNRLQARGNEINLDEAPPMLRMLLNGLGVE